MKKPIFCLLLVGMALQNVCFGQWPAGVRLQFFPAFENANPALTGLQILLENEPAARQFSIGGGTGRQWFDWRDAPRSVFFSAAANFSERQGVKISLDRQANGAWLQTQFSMKYRYGFALDRRRRHRLDIGLAADGLSHGIQSKNLITATADDPLVQSLGDGNFSTVHFAGGGVYRWQNRRDDPDRSRSLGFSLQSRALPLAGSATDFRFRNFCQFFASSRRSWVSRLDVPLFFAPSLEVAWMPGLPVSVCLSEVFGIENRFWLRAGLRQNFGWQGGAGWWFLGGRGRMEVVFAGDLSYLNRFRSGSVALLAFFEVFEK